MKRDFRRIAACAAAVPLLGLGLASTAAAACPAVGTTWYEGNTCATSSSKNAPCYKYVVTGNNPDWGTYYLSIYQNGYYQWVFLSNELLFCS